MEQFSYDTLVEAIQDLKKRGYTEDFNIQSDCLLCASRSIKVSPEDFEIEEVYRFEGSTNPSDSSVLYAIASEKFGLKGVLIDAYGAYANPLNADMIRKLSLQR